MYPVASARGKVYDVQFALEDMVLPKGEKDTSAMVRICPPVYFDNDSPIWDMCVGGFNYYDVVHVATTKSATTFILRGVTPDLIEAFQSSVESLTAFLDAIEEGDWDKI